jgi:CRP-like cAMP-binding protein
LISKGLAVRFDQMRDGRRQIAAFHIPGDMCDLHSVVAPTAAWGIGTLAPTTVLHVPHDELRALAVRYPAIAMAFWRDGTTDASVLAKWVGNLGRQDAHARLAHLLCEMGLRMECAGLGTRSEFTLDASQEQLADALGLTSVHVNRMLQRLRSEGLIGSANRNVTIQDWDGLAAVGEFDPAYLLLDQRTTRQASDAWVMAAAPHS